jgi:hypothetical protein
MGIQASKCSSRIAGCIITLSGDLLQVIWQDVAFRDNHQDHHNDNVECHHPQQWLPQDRCGTAQTCANGMATLLMGSESSCETTMASPFAYLPIIFSNFLLHVLHRPVHLVLFLLRFPSEFSISYSSPFAYSLRLLFPPYSLHLGVLFFMASHPKTDAGNLHVAC